jgi:hypothetical protein
LANRACPQCGTIAPVTKLLAYSDGFECSNCHTRLEDTSGGRSIAVWVGLAAGWLVWRLTRDLNGPLTAVLPELYAILAFGIVSPLVLVFTASVERAPIAPVVEVAAAHGHGGGHAASHGGGHH